MKVPVTGGVSQAIGPPGFGRLNDIHVHKDGAGPLGKYCQLHDLDQYTRFRYTSLRAVKAQMSCA